MGFQQTLVLSKHGSTVLVLLITFRIFGIYRCLYAGILEMYKVNAIVKMEYYVRLLVM